MQNKYGNIDESARLKSLLFALGLSQKRLAEEIEVSRTQINFIVKGERGLSDNIVYRIERKYPSVNPDWLLTGAGEMFKTSEIQKEFEPTDAEEIELRKEVGRLKERLAELEKSVQRERELTDDLRQMLKNLTSK